MAGDTKGAALKDAGNRAELCERERRNMLKLVKQHLAAVITAWKEPIE